MIPWEQLATATAPDGDTLRLMRRGDEFSIRIAGGNELMNSRLGGSEEALATLTLTALNRPAPRILIGGLGMGFTLRAARTAAPDAQIIQAEIVPELGDWARGPMALVFGDCLSDPRTTLSIADVADAMRNGPYDAILLDVDNGPDGLTRPGNDALYSAVGLARAYAALSPGGILSVWSAAPDRAFTRRLGDAGFHVTIETVRAGRSKRGPKHTIWLARRS
ncbi:Spermidine synthase [Rhodobacteraceae bacterium THAF1]|uniref:spermidine synthase n=1 Tax=Palleronia sp. THAF1 TaxID=2587842 RepID=UPI000F3FBF60|nr:spermidine synthase [Palleronia sp. THAF1]QFU07830.1 Spermidine synthase [Palleronia sp. THAF1]VDC25650.1 Spermidine synthase [Rhodobacteraceae bacterium THAF1]